MFGGKKGRGRRGPVAGRWVGCRSIRTGKSFFDRVQSTYLVMHP